MKQGIISGQILCTQCPMWRRKRCKQGKQNMEFFTGSEMEITNEN